MRFTIQTNHAGAPQLCRIVSGQGDAANCREIIALPKHIGYYHSRVVHCCLVEFRPDDMQHLVDGRF